VNDFLLGATGWFAALVVTKAVIEPVATAIGQAFFPRWIAGGLVYADALIPSLLKEGVTGAELERQVREGMERATGDAAWRNRDLSRFWRVHDARVLLDHNAKNQ
jgi:hypothetical protein